MIPEEVYIVSRCLHILRVDSQKLFNPKSEDACQSNIHKQIEESTSFHFTNKKLTTIRVTTRPVDPRVEPRQMEKKERMKSQSELSK